MHQIRHQPHLPERLAPLEQVWARAVLLHLVNVNGDAFFEDDEVLWVSGGGGERACLRRLPGGRAVLWGQNADSSFDSRLSCSYEPGYLEGAPAWLPLETLREEEEADAIGYLYWWHGGAWHRASHPEELEGWQDKGLASWIGDGTEQVCRGLGRAVSGTEEASDGLSEALEEYLDSAVARTVDEAVLRRLAEALREEGADMDLTHAADVVRRAGLHRDRPGPSSDAEPPTLGAPPRRGPGDDGPRTTDARSPGERFRALHWSDAPLLLPNAWDHASAAALAEAGFAAVGTTSLGVAAAAGLADARGHTREETLRLARGLSRLDVLVSVDVEGGFGTTPEGVAELAAELERMGIAGINLEDGLPSGGLADLEYQQRLIRAVKEAAPSLFLNARTDTRWLPGHAEQTADRVAAYEDAGADGVFVPGLGEEAEIAALADSLHVPLNILHSPSGPPLPVLRDLGVRRVSCGSLLFRAALHGALAAVEAVASGRPLPEGVPSYDQAQALAERFSAP